MHKAESVDDFIANTVYWHDEICRLRKILLSTGLAEEIKWGAPCYTLDGKNIVGMGAFKSYFGLWFHQGALLTDRNAVLVNAQEGKTRALRQWRMTSAGDIRPTIVKRYVREAMQQSRRGLAIAAQRNRPIVLPAELEKVLKNDKAVRNAFRSLRPGQQREYAEYVAEAKRDDTKHRRIRKILPMITAGSGLNDKYR